MSVYKGVDFGLIIFLFWSLLSDLVEII